MKDDKLESANLLQFPTVIGSVVAIVNLGDDHALTLDGATIADIYQGKITKWNDPKIAALNKGATLPDIAIRAGLSFGTPRARPSCSLPTSPPQCRLEVEHRRGDLGPVAVGAGAKGNEGVAGTVKNTKGAIGYVEFIYAAANKLATTDLVNKAGKGREARDQGVRRSRRRRRLEGREELRRLDDRHRWRRRWPITSATFILLPKNRQCRAVGGSHQVLRLGLWCGRRRHRREAPLHPLPDASSPTSRRPGRAT